MSVHDVSHKGSAVQDPFRPVYHLSPPAGWMNDPNGLVYFQGYYHVFFQYDPYKTSCDLMHWGHFRSKDLISWEVLPIALNPDKAYDQDGVFSGSAIVSGDELVLIYTGNRWLGENRERIRQVQCAASSRNGVLFTKFEDNPIIEQLPIPASMHVRDPKVWNESDKWWMVLGNEIDGRGRVLLFSSIDLHEWDFVSIIAESDGLYGYMWECPDLFELDGKRVLLFSPQGIFAAGDRYQNLYQTGCFVGNWNEREQKFVIPDDGLVFEELDFGFDFYAAQTTLAQDGRRLMWAWMDMWENPGLTSQYGWAGALTIPRELSLGSDGRVWMAPARELLGARGVETIVVELLDSSLAHREISYEAGTAYEMSMSFGLDPSENHRWSVWLRASEDGSQRTEFRIIQMGDQLNVEFDRTLSGEGALGLRKATVPVTFNGLLTLRFFVDRSSVELFVNDGQIGMTGRIFPNITSDRVRVFAEEGHGMMHSMVIYPLRSIWMAGDEQ